MSTSDASSIAANLQRSLTRDFNLLLDLESRVNRKNAIKKIRDTLLPHIEQAVGKKPAAVAVKPALIFSAKEAAAAATKAAAAASASASSSSPASVDPSKPLSAAQLNEVQMLDELLVMPSAASSSVSLLTILCARLSDEMETVRSQTLELTVELVDAVAAHSKQSYLQAILPIIHARLAPSAATLSAASSFAASGVSASASGSTHIPISSSNTASSFQDGIAIPNAVLGGASGVSSSGHLEPSEELRLKLLELLVKLVEKEREKQLRSKALFCLEVESGLDRVVAIVLKTVHDPFPDLKKESCHLITLLSEVLSSPSSSLTAQARADASTAFQKALLTNLKHQHSQVRLQALQAFGSVIRIGGESLSPTSVEALPLLSTLLFDRTPKLREVFIAELQSWLLALPNLLAIYQTKFISLLLQLTADEVPAIAQRAIEAIDKVAASQSMSEEPSDQTPASGSTVSSSWLPAQLAFPFVVRPPVAARQFICGHLTELLPSFLADLSDWTQTKRLRAAATLKSLLVYSEDAAIPHLILLLQAIIKSIRDEDQAIHVLICQCAQLLGASIADASIWLEWILPELERNADVNYRTSLLLALHNLIQGMPVLIQPNVTANASSSSSSFVAEATSLASQSKLDALFPVLLETLAHPDLCCSDELAIRLQLHRILSCILSRMPKWCGSKQFAQQLFHMLIQLDTKGVSGASASAATASASAVTTAVHAEEEKQFLTALELLARCEQQYGDLAVVNSAGADGIPTSFTYLSAVYCAHFVKELRQLFGDSLLSNPSEAATLLPESWGDGKGAPHFVLLTFFQLLERGIGFVAMEAASNKSNPAASSSCSSLFETELPMLLPILVHSARPANDSISRSLTLNFLYKLVLLKQVLSSTDTDFITTVVRGVIVPTCIWKSGRVAASLRLHALTLAHAMCAEQLFTVQTATTVSPALFPILKSNLDDDEPKLRMLVLLILQFLLELVPSHTIRMDDDGLTEFHRELLKRLDDSHDEIRLQVIRTFSLLFHRVFPPANEYDKTDSYFRYLLSCFFIYLDDANPKVIEACFQFLQSAISYNKKVFIDETQNAKKKQTTGRYCDQLLELAQQM